MKADRTDRTPQNRIKKADKTLIPKLEDLRSWVENINRAPDISCRGGSFRGLDITQVYITKVDGVEVGYQLQDLGAAMKRRVFVKFEQPVEEVPSIEADPIMVAIYEVFLDKGNPSVSIEMISPFCMLVEQLFMPLLLTRRDVPGIRINDEPLGSLN